MASKIQSHNFYVAITPYTVEDSSGEEFNELSVMTAYDDRRKYFYVSIHAGWKSDFGHGCVIMGNDDPLTAPKYVKVKDAPKNSQKTINEMGAALETAKDAIAWLFNQRDWTRLYAAVRNIALHGYTEQFRKQMEELINSNNNQNKEDNTMRLNMNKNQKNETKNVQNAQVMNNTNAPAVEDAVAEEVVENVNVGEATIDNIMPSMSAPVEEEPVKTEEPKDDGVEVKQVDVIGLMTSLKKNGTAKLSDHATLVVGGAPKPTEKPKVTLRTKTKQTEPDPEAVGELAGMLTKVRLFEYTTSHNEKALGIAGFSGEDDPRWKPIRDERRRLAAEYKEAKAKDPKAKAKSHPIYLSRMMDPATGGWCNTMLLGPRYMDVAKQLCEAYNTDDREAWATAVQAVKDCKTAISNGFQAERTARRAARKAEREAQNPQPSAVSPQPSKTYTAAEMEALVRAMAQAMATAQGADVKDFEPLVQAAMKKAA